MVLYHVWLYTPCGYIQRWLRDGNPLPVLDFNFKDMEGIKVQIYYTGSIVHMQKYLHVLLRLFPYHWLV